MSEFSRRSVLLAGGAGAGLAAVAGCTPSGSAVGAAPKVTMDPANMPMATSTEYPTTSGSSATALTRLDIVPVGGSASAKLNGVPVVISQPTAGIVKAFTAICTHMGCTVAPAGRELHCPCHGSVFDAFTGSVKKGPASRPLRPVPATVIGDNVQLG